MMTSLKLGLLLLLTLLPGPSDQIKKQKLESQGKQRNYYLFVPESASQAKNPALLVLFLALDGMAFHSSKNGKIWPAKKASSS
jgi:hypothetical protein